MQLIEPDEAGEVQALALAFAPDSRALAVSTPFRGVTLYDLTGDQPVVRVRPDGFRWRPVIAFEPGGVLVAITAEGRTRYDPVTATRLGVSPHDSTGPGPALAFASSLDGTRLVTAQGDELRTRLISWEVRSGGWERCWSADSGPSSDPALTAAGDRVAVLTIPQPGRWDDYQLVVRDTATGRVLGAGSYPHLEVGQPCFRPDGRQVVVPHHKLLMIWDGARPGKPHRVANDSGRHFKAAAFHPAGRFLFTTSYDGTVGIWDADNWTWVRHFAWDIGRLLTVAVSPDGLLAAAGSDRGRVVVWDVDL
jgi:WD40 repeat protein